MSGSDAIRSERSENEIRSADERRQSWPGICFFAPGPLKDPWVDLARVLGASLNDVALMILGYRYVIPVALSGRAPSCAPGREAGPVVIRVPRLIKRALVEEAVSRETNLTDLLQRILAEALDVELDLKPPRRKAPFGGGRRAA